MATHSSTLAWKIPWTEEPGRLQSMRSWRVWHDWATSLSLFTFMHWRRKWQPTPVFLPGESQGWGEPGGLPSMRSHRVGHDWSDLAAAAGSWWWTGKPGMLQSMGLRRVRPTEWLNWTWGQVSCLRLAVCRSQARFDPALEHFPLHHTG